MKKLKLMVAACVLIAGALVIYSYRSAHHRDVSQDTVAAVESPVAEWLSNADQAATTARAENKDILIEFDGPASPENLKELHPAVLDSRAFRALASRQFILVRLAPPADASPEQATLVATWAQRLRISEFPTLTLLDSQSRPYASSPCRSLDLAAASALLDRLGHVKTRRDQCIASAGQCDGIERARHLDEALQQVGPYAGEAYSDVMRQILVLDSANAAGLRAKYQNTVAEIDINGAIQGDVYPQIDKGNLTGAMQRIDRLIAETPASEQQRQLLLAFKGQLYFSLHDLANAARTFDDAIRIAPQSETAAKVIAARAQILGPAS